MSDPVDKQRGLWQERPVHGQGRPNLRATNLSSIENGCSYIEISRYVIETDVILTTTDVFQWTGPALGVCSVVGVVWGCVVTIILLNSVHRDHIAPPMNRRHMTVAICTNMDHIDGLVQERRNSIANALELRLSSTNPSTGP